MLLLQPVNSAQAFYSSANWRSKQQNQQTSSERELRCLPRLHVSKRQLAERDEELAILQAAILREAPEMKYVLL